MQHKRMRGARPSDDHHAGAGCHAPDGASTPPSFSETFINAPGLRTFLSGVNDRNEIVGYVPGKGGTTQPPWSSFLYSDGTFTPVAVPGSTYTLAFGINDRGEIVGQSSSGSFLNHNGSFTIINVPGATATRVDGINNQGDVVGNYSDASSVVHGFVEHDGAFTTVDVPGAASTSVNGINDRGEMVGSYTDANGQNHGFTDDGGCFTLIDVPGATWTMASAINVAGEVVGTYFDSAGDHGFLYDHGRYYGFDGPDNPPSGGGASTFASGINAAGVIVGNWQAQGLVLTPDTGPGSMAARFLGEMVSREAGGCSLSDVAPRCGQMDWHWPQGAGAAGQTSNARCGGMADWTASDGTGHGAPASWMHARTDCGPV